MLQRIPTIYAKNSEKGLFISAKSYEKYIVCKDYCIAHHKNKTFFLPDCKYHIILLGEIEELRHKLNTFCFTYENVECLYTVFKYRFNMEKLLQTVELCLTMGREQSFLTEETEEWTKGRVLQKRVS